MSNMVEIEVCWPCDPRGAEGKCSQYCICEPTPNGRALFFHLFSIDAVSADNIDYVDVELPSGKIIRYLAPVGGEVLCNRAVQSIAAAQCIGKVKRPWLRCAHCGLASNALGWVTICDPGQQPIRAWLHRECENALLHAKAMRKAS
jgi:hypothetical protein